LDPHPVPPPPPLLYMLRVVGCLAAVKYDMDKVGWEGMSGAARDMLGHMLVMSPQERWTAKQLLAHPWLQEACSEANASLSVPKDTNYLSRLRAYNSAKRMQRLCFRLLAAKQLSTRSITDKEVARLQEVGSLWQHS
jgi:serine/threonine protein kinase